MAGEGKSFSQTNDKNGIEEKAGFRLANLGQAFLVHLRSSPFQMTLCVLAVAATVDLAYGGTGLLPVTLAAYASLFCGAIVTTVPGMRKHPDRVVESFRELLDEAIPFRFLESRAALSIAALALAVNDWGMGHAGMGTGREHFAAVNVLLIPALALSATADFMSFPWLRLIGVEEAGSRP